MSSVSTAHELALANREIEPGDRASAAGPAPPQI